MRSSSSSNWRGSSSRTQNYPASQTPQRNPYTPPTQTTQSTPPPRPSSPSVYITSNIFHPIIPLRDEDYEQGDLPRTPAYEIAQKYFPQNWHYIKTSTTHHRQYYEDILIHTGSIRIDHEKDLRNPSKYQYSKVEILNILTEEDWGTDPWNDRFLDPKYQYRPNKFNYYDYICAWHNVFYYQNINRRHSWFLYFSRQFRVPQYMPNWMVIWFREFGPEFGITPDSLQKTFDLWEQYTEPDFPPELYFYQQFNLPWIISWSYGISDVHDILWLGRQYASKW